MLLLSGDKTAPSLFVQNSALVYAQSRTFKFAQKAFPGQPKWMQTSCRFTAGHASTVFDTKTGRYLYPFSAHQDSVTQVLPLQNGLHILTSSLDNTHKLWTVEGKGLCTLTAPHDLASLGASLPSLSACEKYVMAGHNNRQGML